MRYYKTLFDITQDKSFTLTEIESMYPFERDLYIDMINQRNKQLENA